MTASPLTVYCSRCRAETPIRNSSRWFETPLMPFVSDDGQILMRHLIFCPECYWRFATGIEWFLKSRDE